MRYSTCFLFALAVATGACSGAGTGDNEMGPPRDLSSGGGPDQATARGIGGVSLISTTYMAAGMTISDSSAVAGFGPGSGSLSSGCTGSTIGVCQIATCQLPTLTTDGGMPQQPDAGTIRITGGKMPVMLTVKADGSYTTFYDLMNPLWQGGETITVSAPGHVVGAFNAKVTAPAAVQISMPTAPGAGAMLMVPRNADLKLAWTAINNTMVLASLSTTKGNTTVAVNCTFPGSDAMGTIPAPALQSLQAGNGGFLVGSTNQNRVAAGNYDVTFSLQSFATGSDGRLVSYQAKYQ